MTDPHRELIAYYNEGGHEQPIREWPARLQGKLVTTYDLVWKRVQQNRHRGAPGARRLFVRDIKRIIEAGGFKAQDNPTVGQIFKATTLTNERLIEAIEDMMAQYIISMEDAPIGHQWRLYQWNLTSLQDLHSEQGKHKLRLLGTLLTKGMVALQETKWAAIEAQQVALMLPMVDVLYGEALVTPTGGRSGGVALLIPKALGFTAKYDEGAERSHTSVTAIVKWAGRHIRMTSSYWVHKDRELLAKHFGSTGTEKPMTEVYVGDLNVRDTDAANAYVAAGCARRNMIEVVGDSPKTGGFCTQGGQGLSIDRAFVQDRLYEAGCVTYTLKPTSVQYHAAGHRILELHMQGGKAEHPPPNMPLRSREFRRRPLAWPTLISKTSRHECIEPAWRTCPRHEQYARYTQ